MTSYPSQPTSLRQPTPPDSWTTTSRGHVHSSLKRRWRFWSRLLSFRAETTATSLWLVCLHVPSNRCSSARVQQPSWSSAFPSSHTLHRSSSPYTAYQRLLKSDSRHLPNVLQIAQAHPTSRTWSNHSPEHIHYALLLPVSLIRTHYELLPGTI